MFETLNNPFCAWLIIIRVKSLGLHNKSSLVIAFLYRLNKKILHVMNMIKRASKKSDVCTPVPSGALFKILNTLRR